MPRTDYIRPDTPNPHVVRARAILAKHPEIRSLFGPDQRTASYGIALVAFQLIFGLLINARPWWQILLLSYVVGAVANHALWVLIHECTHRLVFPSGRANRWFGIFLNLPQVVPSAMAFSKYHMLHHTHQSEYDYDADVASVEEAELIGASPWRKLLFMLFFGFIQGAVRPSRLKSVKFLDRWIILNNLVQIPLMLIYVKYCGLGALAYLGLSTFFALGFHPLGGRWIAEHYVVEEHQETNSYYGPLNKLCFNMGYHNEHHDFMRVPWTKLPEVKRLAPEFYDGLFSYRSWTYALCQFIWARQVSLFDRVVRKSRSKGKEQDQ